MISAKTQTPVGCRVASPKPPGKLERPNGQRHQGRRGMAQWLGHFQSAQGAFAGAELVRFEAEALEHGDVERQYLGKIAGLGKRSSVLEDPSFRYSSRGTWTWGQFPG